MRKIFTQLGITLFAIALVASFGAVAQDDSEELAQVQERVSGLFAEIEPQHIRASPIDGWYMIRKGAIVAYISADGKYLLQGDLIDLDQQVNLSEASRDEARRAMMSP